MNCCISFWAGSISHQLLGRIHLASLGLLERALVIPFIVRDAVACDDCSGTIRTPAAVNVNGPVGLVVQNGQNFVDFILGGGFMAVERHAEKFHPVILY
jgi:hypothetical protein